MQIVGVTGSMGMGKSTVTRLAAARCIIPFWDADSCVRTLMTHNRVVKENLKKTFPQIIDFDGSVQRLALRQFILDCPEQLVTLERIVHPHLFVERQKFYARAHNAGARCCLIDVPLLFETGADRECDFIVVVKAPFFVQYQRILQRQGGAKMLPLLDRQWPSAQKERYADFIVQTGGSKRQTGDQIVAFLQGVMACA